MIYKGKTGTQYNLENSPFNQGGEGILYNIIGKSNLVAKLYKTGKNTPEKERKLLIMVNNPPDKSMLSQIAWPLDIIYDSSNAFVGFIMPRLAKNEDLNVIYEYGPTAKYANLSWRYKINIAKNLCAVLDAVHSAGHVVGDLNPKNISVDPTNGLVAFFDADSFHITDNTGKVYRCGVGMPEYLSAEIQRKMGAGLDNAPLPTFTRESDRFALAIHIFQLLMNGTHPFACRVLPSQASVAFPQPTDNILNGNFPFINPKAGTEIPASAPPLSILPKEMQELFKRAFVAGHTNPAQRPTPEEWYNTLSRLEKNLRRCSIKSTHEYFSGISSCPWCDVNRKFNSALQAQAIKQQPYVAANNVPPIKPPPTASTHYTPKVSTPSYRYRNNSYGLSRGRKILYTVLSIILLLVGAFLGLTFGSLNGMNGGFVLVKAIPQGFGGVLLMLLLVFGVGLAALAYLIFTIVTYWRSTERSIKQIVMMIFNFIIPFVWMMLIAG